MVVFAWIAMVAEVKEKKRKSQRKSPRTDQSESPMADLISNARTIENKCIEEF